jgi:hypothetical protein
MKSRTLLVAVCLALSLPAAAQTPTPTTDRQLLEQLQMDVAALTAKIDAQLTPAPTPLTTIHVPCGTPIQPVLDDALAGTRIELDPGCLYKGTLTVRPKAGASAAHLLTITTRGWTSKGEGISGLVTPADKPRLATIEATDRNYAAFYVPNGVGAGFVRLVGVAFNGCPPAGACDIIRLGASGHTPAEELPDTIVMEQIVILGDPVFGSKRGVSANARNVTLRQSWCAEIFIAGQDTQCFSAMRGGINVLLEYNYLAAGAENILAGGDTIPAAHLVPRQWIVRRNILHKPARWRPVAQGGDGRSRQIKNLFELKQITGALVEENLMVGNWVAAQAGAAVLLNTTTQGTCPECTGVQDVIFRNNVILDSAGGLSIQGYSYEPDSQSVGKTTNIRIEGNYFVLGTARAVMISNVGGEHNLVLLRNSFRNGSSTWITGACGYVWTSTTARAPGCPMQGLQVVSNVFARNGTYGVTAPDSAHGASGVTRFVDAGLEISGNVIGDAPTGHLATYNKYVATGKPNTTMPRAAIDLALTRDRCGSVGPDVGADCATLAPVFEMLQRLPEP